MPPLLALKISYILSKKDTSFHIPSGEKAFIFLAADYGNLGDIAITYAQKELLKKTFPQHCVVEVPTSTTCAQIKHIASLTSDGDIITIVGGGNMGDRYDMFELYRQLVCWVFRNHRIISFPQTTEFTQRKRGRQLFRSATEVYNNDNLTLLARENVSYQFMTKSFNCHCVLTPDIVMTLHHPSEHKERNGITLCLRDDSEKSLSDVEQNSIMEMLLSKGCKIREVDTHLHEGYVYSNRYHELDRILETFNTSKLVITDRLHGMIFAYITGTPALVLPNINGKIAGCYNWIKDCGFILFMESFNPVELSANIDTLCDTSIDYDKLNRMTSSFKEIIKSTLTYFGK